jgi:hypothetical protein
MNLKDYYREIEAQESAIDENFVLVASLPTPNGGRAGVVSEVNRATAAMLIVEGKARLLSDVEAIQLKADKESAQRQKDLAELQDRVRMTRLAEEQLQALKKSMQAPRKAK